MSSLTTAADVPLLVVSHNSRSERRISPAWTVSQLRQRLEPITGIPASSQLLSLRNAMSAGRSMDDSPGSTLLQAFDLQGHAELHVGDGRPAGARENYTDVSAVEKYQMPADEYEHRTDTVLAWKKAHQLGRFDPNAPTIEEHKIALVQREVRERGLELGKRCRLLPEQDARLGAVRYIGPIPEIPGLGAWIGIELDEPTGRNDGSVAGARYFATRPNCGVFVRPERVEVGDFAPVDDFDDEDEF